MEPSSSLNAEVERHYARPDLETAILAALSQAGKDFDDLRPEELAPVDEFHIRGREATLELARAAGLEAHQHVLDVGSGLGGAARCLAREFGCRVTGIDLADEFCRLAAMLTDRLGPSDLIDYRQGDALDLPFPDEAFDAVWTQHAAMNIPDKATLYREMHRVLKNGSPLAIYDILAGPGGPVLFPVPWARTPETSFLETPQRLRDLLETAGFSIASWEDTTAAARDWFIAMDERIQEGGLPPLGFHVLMGPDFPVMARNQRRNLEEGRIVLAQVVAEK